MKLFIFGGFIFYFWAIAAPTVTEATINARKERLRKEMKQIQQRIEKYQKEMREAANRENRLQQTVGVYDKKIKKLKLQIESLNIAIQETSAEIKKTEKRLSKIEESIKTEKDILAEYLEASWKGEDFSAVEVVFSTKDLSDFFDRLKHIANFRQAMLGTLDKIEKERKKLTQNRKELRGKRAELYNMKGLQEIQKRTLAKKKEDRKVLLAEARQKKRVFMSRVENSKERAEQIKEELYELEGVGISMNFKQALDKARFVSEKTGVNPALLLAVLKKESQWGQNMGSGNWRTSMHPKHHDAYLQITKALGVDPDSKPVSAKPVSYSGWGGAMGPAQFMPNTWLGYADQVAELTGHHPPNPWKMEDAMTALALKLKKAGGDKPNYQSQRKAVLQFFAGSYWDNPNYNFYGDEVMSLAQEYKRKIDILNSQN